MALIRIEDIHSIFREFHEKHNELVKKHNVSPNSEVASALKGFILATKSLQKRVDKLPKYDKLASVK